MLYNCTHVLTVGVSGLVQQWSMGEEGGLDGLSAATPVHRFTSCQNHPHNSSGS